MTKVKGLDSVVTQLRKKRTGLVDELKHVDTALSILGKLNGGSRPTRTLSVAARRKIAAAQRARWARVRAGKKAA
jgi:hypothetical protein